MHRHHRHFVALFGLLVVHIGQQRNVLQPFVERHARLRVVARFGRDPLLFVGIGPDRVDQLFDIFQRADRFRGLLHFVGSDNSGTDGDFQTELVSFGRGPHTGQLADHPRKSGHFFTGGPFHLHIVRRKRADRFPQAQIPFRRGCRNPVHRHVADPARRGVDYPAERLVVFRVHDQAHVSQQILDLLALVERHAAVDFIGNVSPAERLLERARLRIGTVQNRYLAVRKILFSHRRSDVAGNQDRLLLIGIGLDHLDFFTLLGSREGAFADLLRRSSASNGNSVRA